MTELSYEQRGTLSEVLPEVEYTPLIIQHELVGVVQRALAAGAQRAEDAAVDRLVTDPNALLATIRAIKAGQQKKDWAAFAGEMLKDKRNRTALRSALSELAPPGRRVAAGAWIGAGTTVGAPPEPGGAQDPVAIPLVGDFETPPQAPRSPVDDFRVGDFE